MNHFDISLPLLHHPQFEDFLQFFSFISKLHFIRKLCAELKFEVFNKLNLN